MQRELTFEEKLDCLEYMIININEETDWFICLSFSTYMFKKLNIDIYKNSYCNSLNNIKYLFPELYILILTEIKKSNKYINKDLNIISTQYIEYRLHTDNSDITKLYKTVILINLMAKLVSTQSTIKT